MGSVWLKRGFVLEWVFGKMKELGRGKSVKGQQGKYSKRDGRGLFWGEERNGAFVNLLIFHSCFLGTLGIWYLVLCIWYLVSTIRSI